MFRENCQIDQSAIPYGWPCIDGKICKGNFVTGPFLNHRSGAWDNNLYTN
jgi:hypothetical protein